MKPRLSYDDAEECGCCSAHHPKTFDGDCRDDENRYYPTDDGSDTLISAAQENREAQTDVEVGQHGDKAKITVGRVK